MNLKLSTRHSDGIAIVDCNGRIVFGEEAAALREYVKELIQKSPRIVLNLNDVTYIDSGGLGMLVGLYTSAHTATGDVKLANLTQRVNQLLQVTKLVTVFEVHETVEDAVKSFTKAARA